MSGAGAIAAIDRAPPNVRNGSIVLKNSDCAAHPEQKPHKVEYSSLDDIFPCFFAIAGENR